MPRALPSRRLIVANFDCELDLLAGVRGLEPRRRPALSAAARAKLELLAPILRVFGGDEDEVVVATREHARYLDSGRVRDLLAWGETWQVQGLREQLGLRTPSALDTPLASWPLHELLWRLPRARPEIVARVHHRSFLFEVAQRLGEALPGARLVESVDALEDLAMGSGPWVLKAPFSAAGRDRVWLGCGSAADVHARQRAQRLFQAQGALLLEPWLERVADFGCCAIVTKDDLRIVSLHQQLVTARGAFRGVILSPSATECAALDSRERERLLATVEGVAAELVSAGYQGPFSVDAWRYRAADGQLRFHPLGEINARCSFGLVGRALYDRQSSRAGVELRLELSSWPVEETASRDAQ